MPSESLPVVVFDRDGTLIEDRHYIRCPEDVVFFPGVPQALATIQSKGYPIFLVSNQSGIGRGLITDEEFQAVHAHFVQELRQAGVSFDEIAYCFHNPEEDCPCRKPRRGLVPDTFGPKSIAWDRSFVVGDHVPDLGLAETLGAAPILVLTGKGPDTRQGPLPARTRVFENMVEFASWLAPA